MLLWVYRLRRGNTLTRHNLWIINMHSLVSWAVRKTHSDCPRGQQAWKLWADPEKVCDSRAKGRGQESQLNRGAMWPTPVLNLPWTDDQEVHDTSETVIILLIAWQLSPAWKTKKSHLPALLYPFLAHVFSPPSLPSYLSYPQRKPVWSHKVLLFRL